MSNNTTGLICTPNQAWALTGPTPEETSNADGDSSIGSGGPLP